MRLDTVVHRNKKKITKSEKYCSFYAALESSFEIELPVECAYKTLHKYTIN